MKLQEIIARIETIPELAGKVQVGMPAQMESLGGAPYCWITNLLEIAGDSPVTGPVRQKVTLKLELTIGARNVTDTLSIRDKVKTALLNYAPDNNYSLMQFRVGKFEFGDPGWVLWRDEFETNYMLT